MAGRKYEVYVQKGRPWYKILSGILFSHLGLFVICIVYAIIGAYAFIAIEKPTEEDARELKINKTSEVNSSIEYLKKNFWILANSMNDTAEFKSKVQDDLNTLKRFVIRYHNDFGYDATEDWEYSWTFVKALLFTVTIMTTIGYGHIYPVTQTGRLFCIFYALVGIPLLLVFMKDIGDLMADGVRWFYSRMCCRWCRVRRRDAELPPGIDRKSRTIRSDEVGKEMYMPTDMVNVPIMVNLVIIFAFLFIGAIIFSNWENLGLGTALYFCFVTLTTIGFGDIVPQKAFTEASVTFYGVFKITFTIVYCIFGIMLITLSMNLMQEQVMTKINWVAAEIGLSGGGNQNEEVVKVTKEDRLKQTPIDMTGNELDFNEKRTLKYMKMENQGFEDENGTIPE